MKKIGGLIKNIIKNLLNNKHLSIDVNQGFQIDNPFINIPWNIDEEDLIELFKNENLKCVVTGYYTIQFCSLNGLECMLGFHFEPTGNRALNELEFFRTDYSDQQKSFDEFQHYFTQYFGEPTSVFLGYEGFNSYEWKFNNIQILHYVFDRFGPEEHMRIKINKSTL